MIVFELKLLIFEKKKKEKSFILSIEKMKKSSVLDVRDNLTFYFSNKIDKN